MFAEKVVIFQTSTYFFAVVVSSSSCPSQHIEIALILTHISSGIIRHINNDMNSCELLLIFHCFQLTFKKHDVFTYGVSLPLFLHIM